MLVHMSANDYHYKHRSGWSLRECAICGLKAIGVNFGAPTCAPCKGNFWRSRSALDQNWSVPLIVFHSILSSQCSTERSKRESISTELIEMDEIDLGSGTTLSVPWSRIFADGNIEILFSDTSLLIVSFTSMFRRGYERGTSSNRRGETTLPRACEKQSATTARLVQVAAGKPSSSTPRTSKTLV